MNLSESDSLPDFSAEENGGDDDIPTVKRHCSTKTGTRGADELRLEAHIEDSVRQVIGIEGTLFEIQEIEKSFRAVGFSIDHESLRNTMSQCGTTTFVGFVFRRFPITRWAKNFEKMNVDPVLFD